ncbi:MAG: hypothetical protein ABIQ52_07440 [Vicinamibacterales bacterium]
MAACLLQTALVRAQPRPEDWYGKLSKTKDFDAPKRFSGTFQIELPRDWQLGPGHTGTVFLVVEKTKRFEQGAAIMLEYQSLQTVMEPSILPSVGAELLKDVQARELGGSDFSQQVIRAVDGRFVIMIQYDRPSLAGAKDHVVQYSMPIGRTMYHLICIAPAAAIQKYRPIFAHTAASFATVTAS